MIFLVEIRLPREQHHQDKKLNSSCSFHLRVMRVNLAVLRAWVTRLHSCLYYRFICPPTWYSINRTAGLLISMGIAHGAPYRKRKTHGRLSFLNTSDQSANQFRIDHVERVPLFRTNDYEKTSNRTATPPTKIKQTASPPSSWRFSFRSFATCKTKRFLSSIISKGKARSTRRPKSPESTEWKQSLHPFIVSSASESNNDRQDRFRHESYSHQFVYVRSTTMGSDNLGRTFDISPACSARMTIT